MLRLPRRSLDAGSCQTQSPPHRISMFAHISCVAIQLYTYIYLPTYIHTYSHILTLGLLVWLFIDTWMIYGTAGLKLLIASFREYTRHSCARRPEIELPTNNLINGGGANMSDLLWLHGGTVRV